jgi:hypothetical protein
MIGVAVPRVGHHGLSLFNVVVVENPKLFPIHNEEVNYE